MKKFELYLVNTYILFSLVLEMETYSSCCQHNPKKIIPFPANFSTSHLPGEEPPYLEASKPQFLEVDQSPRPPKILPRCCGRGSWGKVSI